MIKQIIEILDKNDSPIKILVEMTLLKITWKTLEHGVWVTNSGGGKLFWRYRHGSIIKSLNLSNTPEYSWTGIRLHDFANALQVNSAGNGWMVNGWSYNTGYGDNGYTGLRWSVIG